MKLNPILLVCLLTLISPVLFAFLFVWWLGLVVITLIGMVFKKTLDF